MRDSPNSVDPYFTPTGRAGVQAYDDLVRLNDGAVWQETPRTSDYHYPTTASISIADAEAQLHALDDGDAQYNGSTAYSKAAPGSGAGHQRSSWQPRAANLEMMLTSAWYIFVSTGAVLALILVLAASTVLLGLHLGISQARGVWTEVLRGGAASAGASGIMGGSHHGGGLLM